MISSFATQDSFAGWRLPPNSHHRLIRRSIFLGLTVPGLHIGFIHRVVVIEYDIFIHAFRAPEPIFTIVSNIIAYYNSGTL